MQKISVEDVKKIAQLSNLTLTESEVEKFAKLFTQTLDYINILEELKTKDTLETFQVTGLKNVFQDESETPSTLSLEDALKNAPERKDDLFVTKGVFDRP